MFLISTNHQSETFIGIHHLVWILAQIVFEVRMELRRSPERRIAGSGIRSQSGRWKLQMDEEAQGSVGERVAFQESPE